MTVFFFGSAPTCLLPSNKYPVLCLVLITYYTPFLRKVPFALRTHFTACGRMLPRVAEAFLHARDPRCTELSSSIHSWLVLALPSRPVRVYVLSLLFFVWVTRIRATYLVYFFTGIGIWQLLLSSPVCGRTYAHRCPLIMKLNTA